jgi:hypothetical protein
MWKSSARIACIHTSRVVFGFGNAAEYNAILAWNVGQKFTGHGRHLKPDRENRDVEKDVGSIPKNILRLYEHKRNAHNTHDIYKYSSSETL